MPTIESHFASLLNVNSGIAVLQVVSFAVILSLSFIVIFASYLPARKAVAMEPGDALRY